MLSSITNSILHLHGLAAAALVFALPAAESAIFIGFIFPGETAAVLAGVLAFDGRLNLAVAFVAVIAGAIVGDSIGYFVGRRWGLKLLEGPLSRFIRPQHVARSQAALRRRGGLAVVLGRFTAALRVLVPGFAGMAKLPYQRFLLFNAIGGALWGAAFVLLGYLAGASWRSAAHTAGTAGLIALAVAVVAIVTVILMRRRRRGPQPDPDVTDPDAIGPLP
jgi:membrane protein DedA with SNARE-associated domain